MKSILEWNIQKGPPQGKPSCKYLKLSLFCRNVSIFKDKSYEYTLMKLEFGLLSVVLGLIAVKTPFGRGPGR